jgi:cation:H+ antiporter
MVAIAFAFGITAVLAPMEFHEAPRTVLLVPVGASALLLGLSVDGQLSRLDGGVLLAGFVVAIVLLIALSRRGIEIQATGEVAEALAESGHERLRRWRSIGVLMLSIVAIIVGSEMIVAGSEEVIDRLGLTETVFGMTILALLVDLEELARELPAARRGRPEISYGNVAGSILAFFLFNAGIVALINPLEVDDATLAFYLPVCIVTVLVVTLFMMRAQVSRAAGIVLLAL